MARTRSSTRAASKPAGKQKRSARASAREGADAGGGIPRSVAEFLGVAMLAVGGFLLGALLSYQGGDGQLMGPVGYLAAGALYASLGMAGYLVALGILALGLGALSGRRMELGVGEGLGFAVATLAGCVLLHVTFPEYRVRGYTAGGLMGEFVGEVFLGLFSRVGTYLMAGALMVLGLLASTPLSAQHLAAGARACRRAGVGLAIYLWEGVRSLVSLQREVVERAASGPWLAADEDEDEWEEEDDELDEDLDDEGAMEEGEGEEDVEEGGEEAKAPEPATKRRARKKGANRRGKEAGDREVAAPGTVPPEFDESGSLEVECAPDEEEAPAQAGGARKGRAKKRRAAANQAPEPEAAEEEEPQIVVPEEAPAPSPKAPARKAPPRPEQLGAGSKARPAEVKAAPQEGVPGVEFLQEEPYKLPPAEMFEAAERRTNKLDEEFVREQARRLVNVLAEFKVRGKVTKIHPGPVITRYEFKPEPGVKLSKIESLESDIAMALEALRIRILAPIPGKATVGFEVPNKVRETVYIKEILDDPEFGVGQRLPLALGKDIVGKPRWIDLAKAPHLLVAGATGSGKSVGVNSMISSLLYTASPEDVRMIMIDPKMLELSIYEGIPHLLLPVVTDAEKAKLALQWAVEEMERRYKLLSAAQVRDIGGYNKKLPALIEQWEADKRAAELVAAEASEAARDGGEDAAYGGDLPGMEVGPDGVPAPTQGDIELPPRPTKLPYVVIVIDEFADLMMVASKEVEQCVARIAAKARAAGIHTILATQRPSVDVITGTIKNNFPSRIAFQVTSDVDSRTILDSKGAKQLLGQGDMLYMDRGREPQRIHGCYVSEDEILRTVRFLKRQAKPVYNMDIVRKREDAAGGDADENVDPLYDRAVQIVAEKQKVSTSMLQRYLSVGYNRAAKLVERMEAQGVIGPSRGTAPREVYVRAA